MIVKYVIKEISDNLYTLQLIPSMELIKMLRSYSSELRAIEPSWLYDEMNK
jgi:hypothetical protein